MTRRGRPEPVASVVPITSKPSCSNMERVPTEAMTHQTGTSSTGRMTALRSSFETSALGESAAGASPPPQRSLPQLSVRALASPQHATVLPVPHLQVKNVPDDVYAALRERAAAARSTVRDYVLDLVEEDLARPSVTQWLDEVRASRPARVPGRRAIADALDGAADEIEGLGGR